MSHPGRTLGPALLLLSACSGSPRPTVAIVPPAAITPPLPIVAMPTGASVGMAIPAPLPDGSYPTPNRDLSPAAATWHLRAALNVAALACRGPASDAIVARYNAALKDKAVALKQAETQVTAEFRAAGGDWRDRYDDAMTRLYNFFAFAPVRADFCAVADRTLDDMATLAPDALPGFAQVRLAAIDRPFTDFYRAYDAWRAQHTMPSLALVATVPPAAPPPVLTVDPAVLRQP